MTELQVYFWLILDNIKVLSKAIIAVGGITTFVLILVSTISDYDEISQKAKKKLPLSIIFTLVFSLLVCFMPSSKQYATIKVFPKLINSEIAQEIPRDMKNIYDMAKEHMEKMLKN